MFASFASMASDFVSLELAKDDGEDFNADNLQPMFIHPKYIIHVQHNNERTPPNSIAYDENNIYMSTERHTNSAQCEQCGYECDCHTEIVMQQGNLVVSFRTECGASNYEVVIAEIRRALGAMH